MMGVPLSSVLAIFFTTGSFPDSEDLFGSLAEF